MAEKATVESRSPAIAELHEKRRLVSAIMQGSEAMRNETFLPRYPAEQVNDYTARKNRTFLDNFVDLAINKSVGKIFAKEIKTDKLPAETEKLLENIDRQGRALDPFMMDVANCAFQDGISYVMADMPRTDGVVTLADEKALGVRPYAIHIKPQSVLEVLSEMINGVDTLTRVRIKECTSVPGEGWGYVEIEQVRVWYREQVYDEATKQTRVNVRWELWRENEKAHGEDKWYLYEQSGTTFKSIYLVPFYTNRTGFMLGAPPFQNIAESTLEHFQLKSDYQAALEMCNFSMYFAVGAPDDFQMKVGPRQSIVISDPTAKVGIMETSGVAVGLSLDALKAVEARIETAGVNLRIERAGTVSATASAIDSEDTNAGLKAVAQGFDDSIQQLLGYFAEMMGSDATGIEVEVNKDFGSRHGTDAGLTSLDKALALGTISNESYVDSMIWRGELKPDFDKDKNSEEISQQAPDLSSIKATNMV